MKHISSKLDNLENYTHHYQSYCTRVAFENYQQGNDHHTIITILHVGTHHVHVNVYCGHDHMERKFVIDACTRHVNSLLKSISYSCISKLYQ